MSDAIILTEEQRGILSQAWGDLNLTPEEFRASIEGRKQWEWMDQPSVWQDCSIRSGLSRIGFE